MHTPLSQILQRLRVLSDLEVQESEYTKNLTVGPGQDLMPVSPDAMEMLFEPTPCCAALEAFLNALPPAYLGALTCLMYAGRDGSDPVDNWKGDINTWPAEQMVESICEKYVRMEYIDRAVVALGGAGAVNALPAALVT
jgi:hypothetical protein